MMQKKDGGKSHPESTTNDIDPTDAAPSVRE